MNSPNIPTFSELALSPAVLKAIETIGYERPSPIQAMTIPLLLAGKDVLVGVIDVASNTVETPEDVADTILAASKFVPVDRLFPCTNCGMAPMPGSVAEAKLQALGAGAALARKRLGV